MTIKEFTENIYAWTYDPEEEININDAQTDIENFKRDGFEIPEDITPERYAEEYNRLVNDYVNGYFDGAVELMDDDTREFLHATMSPCTNAAFLKAYKKLHFAKFGEEFKY